MERGRRCSKCGTEKEENKFPSRILNGRTYLSGVCRECSNKRSKTWRETNKEKARTQSLNWQKENPKKVLFNAWKTSLKHKYQITLEEYEKRLRTQNGVCAICGSRQEKIRLAVDHDHVTGQVRWLLCSNCNSTLGFAKDNIEILSKMIQYLKDSSGR